MESFVVEPEAIDGSSEHIALFNGQAPSICVVCLPLFETTLHGQTVQATTIVLHTYGYISSKRCATRPTLTI